MKTTITVADVLFKRAQQQAKKRGITLRALFEEGLRRVLSEPPRNQPTLRDCRVGKVGDPDPLSGKTWDELRELIYE